MQEFVRLRSGAEFDRELKRVADYVADMKAQGHSRRVIETALIGWVTAPVDKAYTADQLRQIFDLAEYKIEHLHSPGRRKRSEN